MKFSSDRSLARSLCCLLALAGSATDALADAGGNSVVDSGSRLALAMDNRLHLRGELAQVFAEDERSAWIGEAWFGRQVGGVKLNRHWLLDRPDAAVGKLFGAWDRNAQGDNKLTLGGGFENESLFWGAYGMFGLSDRREISAFSSSVTDVLSGNDPALGAYVQNLTTTTTLRAFEKAYDYGLGVRLGRFYAPMLARLTAGADHEWGKASANLTTVSLLLEKYFAGSPHSVALNLAANRRQGDFETQHSDRRIGFFWRYDLGGARAAPVPTGKNAAMAAQPFPATLADSPARRSAEPVALPPSVETTEVFFPLGKADLLPAARQELDVLLEKIRGASGEYRLVATAHTCDLGSEAFNQRLSERRAAAVRDYLIAGGLLAGRIVAEGRGELSPRYSNKRNERKKNRRCEIELTVTPPPALPAPLPPTTAVAPPALIEPAQAEPRQTPPWLQRALYNPVRHKQEVDVYRSEERETSVFAGERTYLNRPPVARDDSAAWTSGQAPVAIDVLANDSDPDGDRLSIVSVTQPGRGTASIGGDGKVYYQGQAAWDGSDVFSYTVSDGKNKTATARVSVQVSDNRAPVARDDSGSWMGSQQPGIIDVLANDHDPDGDPLTIVSVTQGSNGTVTISPDGKRLHYQGRQGWDGIDRFTYTVSDGRGKTATARVTFQIVDP